MNRETYTSATGETITRIYHGRNGEVSSQEFYSQVGALGAKSTAIGNEIHFSYISQSAGWSYAKGKPQQLEMTPSNSAAVGFPTPVREENGTWTYAVDPDNPKAGAEAFIQFLIGKYGTKGAYEYMLAHTHPILKREKKGFPDNDINEDDRKLGKKLAQVMNRTRGSRQRCSGLGPTLVTKP